MNDDDWLLRGLSGAHTHGAFEAQAEPEMLWLNLPFDSLSGIQSPALPASPMSPLTGLGPAVLSPSKFASSMQPSAKLTLPETVQPSLSVRPGDLLSPVSELSVSVPDYAQKSKRQRNTEASARFRQKRKQRESERMAQLEAAQTRISELEAENLKLRQQLLLLQK
ncbi:MAG: hypothetical protein SGCHY_002749 [Lobulomycetales sp.]